MLKVADVRGKNRGQGLARGNNGGISGKKEMV